jgi:TonB-dependent starch-binding outer membrane protein SusC
MQTQHRYRALWGLAMGLAAAALAAAPLAAQQTGSIEGTVTDAADRPISGAQVNVVATQRGTITGADGTFRIANVEAGEREVRATRIGYRSVTQRVQVSAGEVATVSITLAETAVALDELLVTGTAGRQDRRAQSASIASMDAAGIMEVAPVSTMADLLQGRTPGVSLTQASGTSGGGQRIRLRGAASINLSNEPIVIVDGVRIDSRNEQIYGAGGQQQSRLNDINPDEIESIEIVRGPAAATLYGSDAGAGVIHIRTKRGQIGGAFTQTLSLEGSSLHNTWDVPANWGVCTQALINAGRELCVGQAPGTVIQDRPLDRYNAFRTGRARSLAWSGRGGGENFGYFFSFSTEDEDGVLPGNEYDRMSGRMNFDFVPTERLRIEAGFGVNRTFTDMPQNDNNIYCFLGGALLGGPTTVGTAADGWFAANRQVDAITAIENTNTTVRSLPRLSIHYSPLDWFTNRLTIGADILRTEADQFYPRNPFGWYGTAVLNSGQIQEARRSRDEITLDYLGSVTHQLTDDLSSDFAVGFQINSISNDLTFATGQGLTTNEARAISAAATTTGGQNYSAFREIGGLAQWDLGWRDRLFVQLGGRLDQNSAFGAAADPFFSPRLGVSYVVSEEDFWMQSPLASAIPTLRVRGAWGTTGNSPGATAALEIYEAAPFITGAGTVGAGVIPDQPGNPDLRPERGTELELGVEAGFFQDRLGLDINWFNKVAQDVALLRPTPPSLGFTQNQWVNLGEMVNRGFEVGIDGRLLDLPDFGWDARLSFNTLHNEVTDLGELDPIGRFTRVVPGYQVHSIWTHQIQEFVTEPGDERCPLSGGQRVPCAIVSDTTEFHGNSIPTFEGNFGTTMTFFQNLRLYTQFDWMQNFVVYNNTDQFRERQFGTGERWINRDALPAEERLRRFGPFRTDDGDAITSGDVTPAYHQDASFVKLREVSLSYTVPRGFLQRFGVSGATVTLAGRNLATWTDYEGPDPEVMGGLGWTANTRSEFLTLPQLRRFVLRTNFTF